MGIYCSSDICHCGKCRLMMYMYITLHVLQCNSVIIVLAIYAIFIASRRKVKNRQMTEITAAKLVMYKA